MFESGLVISTPLILVAEDVVSQVVRQYDVMSDAMSLGIQHCWKDYFIKKLQPTNDTNLLDVASGTGNVVYMHAGDHLRERALYHSLRVC